MNWQESVRSPEALLKAIGHDQAQHSVVAAPPDPMPAMTVAISRQAGALGTSVANELGRRLGWPVYDHALLERMAAEMRVQVDLLESIDERHVGWLVERMEDFSAVPYVSENAYVRRLIETLLALGRKAARSSSAAARLTCCPRRQPCACGWWPKWPTECEHWCTRWA